MGTENESGKRKQYGLGRREYHRRNPVPRGGSALRDELEAIDALDKISKREQLPHDQLAGVMTGNGEHRTVELGPAADSTCQNGAFITEIPLPYRYIYGRTVLSVCWSRDSHRRRAQAFTAHISGNAQDHSPRSPGDTNAENNARVQLRGKVVSSESFPGEDDSAVAVLLEQLDET